MSESPGPECIWRSAGRWRAAPGGRQSRRPSRFLNGIAPQTQADADARAGRDGRAAPTPRCRVCNGALTTPAAIMLRRCESCPSDIDDELLAELKDWRLRTSKEHEACPRTWCSPTTR